MKPSLLGIAGPAQVRARRALWGKTGGSTAGFLFGPPIRASADSTHLADLKHWIYKNYS
ncbi:hypothetical protein PATSB16_36370 [Pandoraea thiooxydans]|nr:hypothetical protein PATSB16_36370 [Pandoraea thiooxydans]